ncbi:MAG: hypothetical protein GY765_20520 [bacterium]|nr:hypothetical protein [bacterium]
MKTAIFSIIAAIVLVGFVSCGASSGPEGLLKEVIKATNRYTIDLESVKSAKDYAEATNRYAEAMEKLGPQMKALAETHPGLKSGEVPESMKPLMAELQASMTRMMGANTKMMQYAGDAEVQAATARMGKAMSGGDAADEPVPGDSPSTDPVPLEEVPSPDSSGVDGTENPLPSNEGSDQYDAPGYEVSAASPAAQEALAAGRNQRMETPPSTVTPNAPNPNPKPSTPPATGTTSGPPSTTKTGQSSTTSPPMKVEMETFEEPVPKSDGKKERLSPPADTGSNGAAVPAAPAHSSQDRQAPGHAGRIKNSLALVTAGNCNKKELVVFLVEENAEEVFDRRYTMIENSDRAAYHLFIKVRDLGSKQLKYYGNTTTQYTLFVTLKVIDTRTKRVVAGPVSRQIGYTALNEESNIKEAIAQLVRQL